MVNPSQSVWRIVVPRFWGLCPTGPEFETETAARDWLAQFGPLDGRVIGGSR
jgi:hypothetical protein